MYYVHTFKFSISIDMTTPPWCREKVMVYYYYYYYYYILTYRVGLSHSNIVGGKLNEHSSCQLVNPIVVLQEGNAI